MGPEQGGGMNGKRLLVVGAGAIANRLLPHLAQQQWAAVTVMDGDRVEEKNLERQELFAPVDIGRPKSVVAAAWLRHAPIRVHITARDEFIDANNAETRIAMHDVVADCTDDAHVKRLLDRTCGEYGVALVSGSVHGKEAQVIALHAEGEGDGISRDDLFQGKVRHGTGRLRHAPGAARHDRGDRTAHGAAAARRAPYQEPVANGRIDLFDGKRWSPIDPPKV
jgi:molybdopterin/thiamine biosynthesis adenylyltransferase